MITDTERRTRPGSIIHCLVDGKWYKARVIATRFADNLIECYVVFFRYTAKKAQWVRIWYSAEGTLEPKQLSLWERSEPD